jgi:hypothetical protein
MAKRGRPKKQQENAQGEPVPGVVEPVVARAKRGRPKKSQGAAKPGGPKKERKSPKSAGTVTVEIPAHLLDLIPGEAIAHFLEARKHFLRGMQSMINGALESSPAKKMTASKGRTKTGVKEKK